MSSFYVTFQANKETFKGTLTSQFNKPYRLRGEWEVGVYVANMPDTDGMFWVFSDIVDFTYINEVPMQLMDVVEVDDMKNSKPMYAKVIRKRISTINVAFRRNPSSDAFEDNTSITCVLHFRKA